MVRICAAIVTYNRKNYLIKLLTALKRQSRNIDGILIFDNHSTDGTVETLRTEGIIENEITQQQLLVNKAKDINYYYYLNNSNIGGSGGFHNAVKLAFQQNYDYIWVMDDDVEPDSKCLERLLNRMKLQQVDVCIPNRSDNNFQDRACIKLDMNSVKKYRITLRKSFAESPFKKDFYSVEDMSFEGPLISANVINKIGFPDSSYFIEYDDTDYARRLLKYTNIIFVTDAVMHRQLVRKDNLRRAKFTWRDYYSIRNNIIFNHKYGKSWGAIHVSTFFILLWNIAKSIKQGHISNMKIIAKAVIDGVHDRNGKTVSPNK